MCLRVAVAARGRRKKKPRGAAAGGKTQVAWACDRPQPTCTVSSPGKTSAQSGAQPTTSRLTVGQELRAYARRAREGAGPPMEGPCLLDAANRSPITIHCI